MINDTSYLTHTGVEVYMIRRFETTCYVHILDLDHAKIKLVNGFSNVTTRAQEMSATLAFNANGWGLQQASANLSNEYLVIEGVVIQATAIDYRPCMNISKDGIIEFLDHPNFRTAWNVIGFDRYIARSGVYNTAINNNTPDPRTVYGKDASGCLVILVCEGRQAGEKGLTFKEVWSVMQEFGVTDCGNADGGYSSCAYNEFFPGGLMNESYKVEYRRTVMQVLFFANQLGEVPPTGDPTMDKFFMVITTNNERMTPSMYQVKTRAGSPVNTIIKVAGGELTPDTDARSNAKFVQTASGWYQPFSYNGKTFMVEVPNPDLPLTDPEVNSATITLKKTDGTTVSAEFERTSEWK